MTLLNQNPVHTLYWYRLFACLILFSGNYISAQIYTIFNSVLTHKPFTFAGSLAPFEVDLELWPKEQCYEVAVSMNRDNKLPWYS